MPAPAGMLHYLKRALFSRWNLLILLGAAAGALLSPWPDVLMPLLAAGEIVYLGGLVSVPRFRETVDAEVAARGRGEGRASAPDLVELLEGLSTDAQRRFLALRKRCAEMRSIAQGASPAASGSADLWTPALDRLLYGFLRLLVQQNSLQRFLRSTTEAELARRKAELEPKLAAARAAADERAVHSLEESVTIAGQRLDNYQKAVKNAEFLGLELDRVEAKIQALIELAANRQDADLLSSQVDAAAESMHRTEAAMSQLQQITGATEDLDQVPAILDPIGKKAVSDDA